MASGERENVINNPEAAWLGAASGACVLGFRARSHQRELCVRSSVCVFTHKVCACECVYMLRHVLLQVCVYVYVGAYIEERGHFKENPHNLINKIN